MLQGLKMTLAPWAWRLLEGSLNLEPLSPSYLTGGPYIFSCLHRDILPTIMHVKSARPVLLVSHSGDGDILVRTLGTTYYGYVRGATGEDGGRAFMGLMRHLEAGRNVGIAVDGPKGPFGRIHDGVLQLARLSRAAIVPLVATPSRARTLASWDRTVVPYPWSRVTFQKGPMMSLPRQAKEDDMILARRDLARFFGVEEENR